MYLIAAASSNIIKHLVLIRALQTADDLQGMLTSYSFAGRAIHLVRKLAQN